jgi:hypothetical protein
MALRAYHGVAGRKPALPTWVVTSGARKGAAAAAALLRCLDGCIIIIKMIKAR